jgi:hypothetical protein
MHFSRFFRTFAVENEEKCTEYHHDSDCAGGPNGVQRRQGTTAATAGTALPVGTDT